MAILRTTPLLLGLFSLVCLFAHQLLQGREMPVRQAVWDAKALPWFARRTDVLACAAHAVQMDKVELSTGYHIFDPSLT